MASNTTDRQLVTVVLLLLGVFVVLPLLFMGGWGMMGGTWSHDMWGDGGAAAGWVVLLAVLIRLLVLAAIVVGAYLLYRTLTGSDGGGDRALEELRLAYARGELTDEEYEERRDRLERED